MSLKAFHIVFIAASILLSGFFGYWQMKAAAVTGTPLDWSLAVLSFLASLTLIVYLFCFIRKMKKTL